MLITFAETTVPSTEIVTVAGPATASVFCTFTVIVDAEPACFGSTVTDCTASTGYVTTTPYQALRTWPSVVRTTTSCSFAPSVVAEKGRVAIPFASVMFDTGPDQTVAFAIGRPVPPVTLTVAVVEPAGGNRADRAETTAKAVVEGTNR